MFHTFIIISACWLLFVVIPCLFSYITHKRSFYDGVDVILKQMMDEGLIDLNNFSFVKMTEEALEKLDGDCYQSFLMSRRFLVAFFITLGIFAVLVAVTVILGIS